MPENYELDRGEDDQIDDDGDEPPTMPLSKFPGECRGGRVHGLRLWICDGGRADTSDEDFIEGENAPIDAM